MRNDHALDLYLREQHRASADGSDNVTIMPKHEFNPCLGHIQDAFLFGQGWTRTYTDEDGVKHMQHVPFTSVASSLS